MRGDLVPGTLVLPLDRGEIMESDELRHLDQLGFDEKTETWFLPKLSI